MKALTLGFHLKPFPRWPHNQYDLQKQKSDKNLAKNAVFEMRHLAVDSMKHKWFQFWFKAISVFELSKLPDRIKIYASYSKFFHLHASECSRWVFWSQLLIRSGNFDNSKTEIALNQNWNHFCFIEFTARWRISKTALFSKFFSNFYIWRS